MVNAATGRCGAKATGGWCGGEGGVRWGLCSLLSALEPVRCPERHMGRERQFIETSDVPFSDSNNSTNYLAGEGRFMPHQGHTQTRMRQRE